MLFISCDGLFSCIFLFSCCFQYSSSQAQQLEILYGLCLNAAQLAAFLISPLFVCQLGCLLNGHSVRRRRPLSLRLTVMSVVSFWEEFPFWAQSSRKKHVFMNLSGIHFTSYIFTFFQICRFAMSSERTGSKQQETPVAESSVL